MGKTKFQAIWQTADRFWIKPVKGNEQAAFCTLCKIEFRIDNRGISQVTGHEETVKHAKLIEKGKQNSSLLSKKNKDGQATLCLSSTKPKQKELSHNELVLQAESLQAFHIVDANIPFSAADGDGERFRMQFPELMISQDYRQALTKTT